MNVVFAPSISWLPAINTYEAGSAPDPSRFFRDLEHNGVASKIVDLSTGYLNPFHGRDTLLQSIDPWRSLKLALWQREADILVSVFEGAAASLAAMRWLLGSKTSVVMWDVGLTDWKLRNKLINFALPRIDDLMVLGTNQVDYVNKTYSNPPSISVVGHYIDTEFYQQQLVCNSGHILSVGDDVGRDFPTLIQATQGLGRAVVIKASRHPPQGTHADVQVIRHRVSYLELRELYANSAVVVVPTFVTPNACGVSSILEASAMGRPLIVSDNPGIHDFVVPNETCLMVPPNDATALREAIRFLLANPLEGQRLADGARAFVDRNCTSAVFAERFARALCGVVARRARA